MSTGFIFTSNLNHDTLFSLQETLCHSGLRGVHRAAPRYVTDKLKTVFASEKWSSNTLSSPVAVHRLILMDTCSSSHHLTALDFIGFGLSYARQTELHEYIRKMQPRPFERSDTVEGVVLKIHSFKNSSHSRGRDLESASKFSQTHPNLSCDASDQSSVSVSDL